MRSKRTIINNQAPRQKTAGGLQGPGGPPGQCLPAKDSFTYFDAYRKEFTIKPASLVSLILLSLALVTRILEPDLGLQLPGGDPGVGPAAIGSPRWPTWRWF